jgi:hypothetical protein
MLRFSANSLIRYEMAIEKKLFVYDSGRRDAEMDYARPNLHSGIRATIFGASGKASFIKEISE